MREIQGKSILVRVSARFELARVRVIGSQLYHQCNDFIFFYVFDGFLENTETFNLYEPVSNIDRSPLRAIFSTILTEKIVSSMSQAEVN